MRRVIWSVVIIVLLSAPWAIGEVCEIPNYPSPEDFDMSGQNKYSIYQALEDLAVLIILILIPGALGGGVHWMSVLCPELKQEGIGRAKDILTLPLFSRAVVGCGGAVGITLVLIVVNNLSDSNPIKDPFQNGLYLFSLSFVSGFVGHRLLPIVAARLEQKVAESMKVSEEAKNKSQRTKEIANRQTAAAEAALAAKEAPNNANNK